MVIIAKEKNMYGFTIADGKTYHFDVNTGSFIGLRGAPIHSCPIEIRTAIANSQLNVLQVIDYARRYENSGIWQLGTAIWVSIFNIADRLQSLDYRMSYEDIRALVKESDTRNYCTDNFKKLGKFYKNHSDTNHLITDFRQSTLRESVLADCGPIDEHFTEGMFNTIAENLNTFDTVDKRKAAAYFFARGLWNFYDYRQDAVRKIREYFNYCELLDWDIREKGNFMNLFIQAKETYELKKDEINDKILLVNQNRFASYLAFEDENLIVTIPTTSKSFEEEAENQHNCVFRMYLPRCVNGDTNVVFIRRKESPNESYITCEVSNSGRIIQYYRAYNRTPTSPMDVQFYNNYADHLRKVWNR